MTTTIAAIPLPADVQEALAREAAYAGTKPQGGRGGREWDFDSLPAPDMVGQTKEHHRIFLPTSMPMQGLPWKIVPVHSVMAQGDTKMVTCPHRYALLLDPKSQGGPPPPCPLCEGSDYGKEHARDFPRDSPENKELWEKGVGLGARDRCYSNTIDLDNLARHWKTNEAGVTEIIPTISAYGTEVVDGLKATMGEVGMFWHPQAPTRIKISASRTGKLAFNVDRDVRMVLPLGGGLQGLPDGLINYMIANLNDLNAFVQIKPYEQLKSFVPAWARPNVQVQVPGQLAALAPPQAMPPPLPMPAAVAPVAAPAIPPLPAMPVAAAPAVAAPPPMPTMPAMPAPVVAVAPGLPALPPMPGVPVAAPAAAPGLPAMPAMPAMPGVPSLAAPASPSPPSSAPSMPPMPAMPPLPKIG